MEQRVHTMRAHGVLGDGAAHEEVASRWLLWRAAPRRRRHHLTDAKFRGLRRDLRDEAGKVGHLLHGGVEDQAFSQHFSHRVAAHADGVARAQLASHRAFDVVRARGAACATRSPRAPACHAGCPDPGVGSGLISNQEESLRTRKTTRTTQGSKEPITSTHSFTPGAVGQPAPSALFLNT